MSWRARSVSVAALAVASTLTATGTLARPVAIGDLPADGHVIFFFPYSDYRHPEAVSVYSNLCVGEAGRQGVRVLALRSPFESDAGSAPGVVFIVQFAEGGSLRSELAEATVGDRSELVLRGQDNGVPWSFDAAWGVNHIDGELRRGPDGPHKWRQEDLGRVDPQQNRAPSCSTGYGGSWTPPRRRQ